VSVFGEVQKGSFVYWRQILENNIGANPELGKKSKLLSTLLIAAERMKPPVRGEGNQDQ
jgi:hypothetical protein